jgi:16S rRNA (cytidine1402-2'-O)-methyltransferase
MVASPSSESGVGTLYVVATPIGNVEDLSPRAREILAAVDFIAAEDTRHTGRLMQRLGIRTPLVSLHEHNEVRRTPELLARLESGEAGALVSDAGTPLVSDPGYRLLCAVRASGVPVSPLPGPCAAVAAVSVAGLPCDRFVFEGFLPQRNSARRRRLEALAGETRLLVCYESSRRLRDTLEDMAAIFGGEREATIARELTKLHEQVLHGTLAELVRAAGSDDRLRMGEIVLVVAGRAEQDDAARDAEAERVLRLLLEDGLSARQSAALAARITGASRNALYPLAVALHRSGGSADAGEGQ